MESEWGGKEEREQERGEEGENKWSAYIHH